MPALSAILALSLTAPLQEAGAGQEAPALLADHQWASWRGPLSTGFAPHADPPTVWSEEQGVRWKLPLPGLGHSSPVVWGTKIFLTSAVPFGDALEPIPELAPGAHDNAQVTHAQRYVALAVDRVSGALLWTRKLREELPHEGYHISGSLASASPVTDGERVFVSFGSRGVYALDMQGELAWSRDLGVMSVKHAHGEGSSPALHDQTLVVNWDHEGASRLLALDAGTGETRWEVERDEPTSWATPIVVEHDGTAQLIVSGTNRLRAYDLEGGGLLWECGGLSHNVVASPVSAQGMVFAGSSYEKQALLAIRLEGAAGDLTTSEELLWMRRRRTPYVPSPLLYGDALYFLLHYQGVLSRVSTTTGAEPKGPFRLRGIGDVYASPVGAAGRLYVTDRSGTTTVLSHEASPRLLALNMLDDSFSASAALVDQELFLRGERHLYCIAAQE